MTLSPPNFNCTKCGKCCSEMSEERGVILFPSDIGRLARELGLGKEKFLSTYCHCKTVETSVGLVSVSFLNSKNGRCVFLDDENLCTVHDFKPEQCARSPFNFFWDGHRDYECMRNIVLPVDWNTEDSDTELVLSLLE